MLPSFLFHHIGIATSNIDKTAVYYINSGYHKTNTVFDPVQNVNIAFLQKDGMPLVELLEPVDEKSPVYKIVKSSGVSPYHCCYIVEDILEAIQNLRKQKYVMVSKPACAIALSNKKICFLFNKEVGLIELLEERK